MKRTYDNAMQSAPSTAGQISAGMAATKENIYMNTNMVTIQREDHTSLHGIESNFNQTRVLPIVGKTSRAEIALKSADVQTKALPMFQPQVAIGPDIDRLIYETGLSASWRNSMLMIPPDNVNISTLLFEGAIPYPGSGGSTVWRGGDEFASYYGESTFTNDSTASLPIIDTYNIKYDLTCLPAAPPTPPVINTQLSVLLNYWKTRSFGGLPMSDLRKTCLTPVVVPSESEPILSIKLGGVGDFENQYIVSVADTSGFQVGDRVRYFGTSLKDTPFTPMAEVFGTVLDIVTVNQQTTTTSSHLPALVISSNDQVPTPTPGGDPIQSYWFDYQHNSVPPHIDFAGSGINPPWLVVGVQILVQSNEPLVSGVYTVVAIPGGTDITVNAPDGLPNNLQGAPSTIYQYTPPGPPPNLFGGCLINQRVKNGGHIEFLTDQYEFAPLAVVGTTPLPVTDGMLTVRYDGPDPVLDQGFFRGFTLTNPQDGVDLHPMSSAVELTIDTIESASPIFYTLYAKILNGYYTIVQRTYQVGRGYLLVLAPLSKALPVTLPDLTNPLVSFTLKLAPNFHTFDTKADEIIDPVLTSQKLRFMRTLGFVPTDDIPIQKPTYPPTASVPPNTWSRAFQVNWDFSAYRNIRWVSQDTISPKPKPPLISQDYGFDNGSSTYYNVYEFNKFLNDCVNPSIERCINDSTYEVPVLDALSLNNQLALAFNAYRALLSNPPDLYVWNSTTTYLLGDLVITSTNNRSWAFMCTQQTNTILPTTPTSNKFWYFLGYTPAYFGNGNPYIPYELTLQSVVHSNYRVMQALIFEGEPLPISYLPLTIAYTPLGENPPHTLPSTSQIIDTPEFRTVAPLFHYNVLTLLSSIKYDGYSFGTTSVNQKGLTSSQIALYNYNRTSWGFQGYEHADEWMTFESNTSFKFLLDNFPSYCTQYEDTLAELRAGGTQYPAISYWVWDNTSSVDPRKEPTPYYEIFQTSESLSSCMSPVQSIVVVSDNIPVLEELASPVNYLVDSESSSFVNSSTTIGLTQKIIGEFTLPSFAPYNSRSIVKYDTEELKFYSLLDTKLFKQLEYSLYYRHRIAQQLVPLIISNYGSVNIKFVFRPIS